MEGYNGDLEKTAILDELFEIPLLGRDENWKTRFLENVADASFASGDPQVISGPDDFPYFHLITPEPYKSFQCYVIRHMVGDFLLKEGFGVVINPAKEDPDWVFSYGDIVNFHINSIFYSAIGEHQQAGDETIPSPGNVMTGNPSESFLPGQARKAIGNYLADLGIDNVKITLINRIRNGMNIQEIVFNLTPDKFSDEAEYERILRSLSWFFPRHYSYSSATEQALGGNFFDL